MKESFQKNKNQDEITHEDLPEDHWFRIAERLYQESGRIPDPLEIRSVAIIDAFGIPSGETSALETDAETNRINIEKDKIIAKYLTNKAGVVIDEELGIVSSDFRDMYPDGLPEELKNVLDSDTLAVMEAEYEHAEYIEKNFGNTDDPFETDKPVHYFRFPGGIDLFLRGYMHDIGWQREHGKFLAKMNARAEIIGIEGFFDKPFGKSIDLCWKNPNFQNGSYDVLMREAADAGFHGLFTEVDARDSSKISMDFEKFFSIFSFPDLPDDFFAHYFEFLNKEQPALTRRIKNSQDLRTVLIAQSMTDEKGILSREPSTKFYRNNKEFYQFPYYPDKGNASFHPTFLELGQMLFTDALAAVKLHMIAKLMAEGSVRRGPIIDYEGADHLSSKSFFLRYPGYAMEIVLRTANELMAGKVKKKNNIAEIYKVFQNPDWAEIVKEIARLSFKSVSEDGKELRDYPVDFLKIYNINPGKVVPPDAEIKNIRDKIAAAEK